MRDSTVVAEHHGPVSNNLLQVRHLKIHFSRGLFRKQKIRAVNNVSFHIAKGETFGLVGESGCGKTSLARCLPRLIEPTEGEIVFNGSNILSQCISLQDLRKKIQIIFQDVEGALNPRMRAFDLILEPLKIHGLVNGNGMDQASALFEMVNLPFDISDRRPHALSGGQRQRIAIARAVSLSPELIIADEAASSLDILTQAQIVNLLNRLQDDMGMSYLFISHNLKLVRRIADRMAVMYRGKFVEMGNAPDIFTNPLHPYTQALISSDASDLVRPKKPPIVLKKGECAPLSVPSGCPFAARCPKARSFCYVDEPVLRRMSAHHMAACHLL